MISTKKQKLVFENKNTCTSNGSLHGPLITDNVRGEILCASCGAVITDKTEDLGFEQRSLGPEDYSNSTRTGLGSALSIHDKGLSTIIGHTDKDASGNSISTYMMYTFNRLRTWDSRSKYSSSERNLRSAFVIMVQSNQNLMSLML